MNEFGGSWTSKRSGLWFSAFAVDRTWDNPFCVTSNSSTTLSQSYCFTHFLFSYIVSGIVGDELRSFWDGILSTPSRSWLQPLMVTVRCMARCSVAMIRAVAVCRSISLLLCPYRCVFDVHMMSFAWNPYHTMRSYLVVEFLMFLDGW